MGRRGPRQRLQRVKAATTPDRRRPGQPVYPAFWHTVLVRYLGFMDNFLAPTKTCHPADNFGVALTAAELDGAAAGT